MAPRISATGFVSLLALFLLLVLAIIRPGSVVGSRIRTSRLWHQGGSGGGVRGMMVADDRDCATSWRSRERLVAGDEFEFDWGRKGWRKLLFARRRRSAAAGVESPGEQVAPKKLKRGQATGLSHFTAAFSFFSSMAKGSPTPSPATPSPGHN